jgi:N-acetylneuraminate epimerase
MWCPFVSLLPALAVMGCAGASRAEHWQKLPPLPDPLGVAAPFAGMSNGALIVAGGANFPDKMPWDGGRKVWHDKVWVLEKPDGAWREAGKLPRSLAYGVSLTVNGTFFCIGGSDAERHHADVLSYEWRGGKLVRSDVTPGALPISLANAAGAVDANQTIYVACGSTEPGEKQASNRVFSAAFHGEVPRWRELPALPAVPRILPVAAADGEAFYLFGGAALEEKEGKTVRRHLTDAWRYTAKNGWKRLTDLPKPCVAAPSPAPVVGPGTASPQLYLIGGDDGSLAGFSPPEKHPGFPGTILRYDIATDKWSEAGKTPAPRATLPCVVWDKGFILPSGEVRPGVRSPEVWRWGGSLPPPKPERRSQ